MFNFSKPSFGLDIGHETMKIVQISGSGSNALLVGNVEIKVPENSITKTGVKNKKEIASIINQATGLAKPNKIEAKIVASALPESLVFTKLLELPQMSNEELAKAVPFQAMDFFPLPPEETHISWQITGVKPDRTLEILVVAAPKVLIDDLNETFILAGLTPLEIETKPIATTRALINKKDKAPILIIDIGAEASAMTCIDNGTIKLTSTLPFGNSLISKNPEKGVELLANEVNHLTKYYQNKLAEPKLFKKILLSGGGANLQKIPEILEKITRIWTEVGQPIIKIKNYNPKFAVAIGLAMKNK